MSSIPTNSIATTNPNPNQNSSSNQPQQSQQSQGTVTYHGTQEETASKQVNTSSPSASEDSNTNNTAFDATNNQGQLGSDGKASNLGNNTSNQTPGLQFTESQGGATAEGAVKDQFQQAGSNSAHGGNQISKKATDYISKSISQFGAMTLKVQPSVTKNSSSKQGGAMVNENSAPALPEPSSQLVKEAATPSLSDAAFATQSGDSPSDSPLSGKEAGTPSPSAAKETASSNVSQNIMQSKVGSQKGASSLTHAVSKTLSKGSSSGTKITSSSDTSSISEEDTTSGEDPLGSTPTNSQDTFNAYACLISEKSTSATDNLNDVTAQTVAEDFQSYIQKLSITNEQQQINTADTDNSNASHDSGKDSGLGIMTIVISSVEMAAGVALLCIPGCEVVGAMLIIGGVTGIVMTEDGTQIMNGVAKGIIDLCNESHIPISKSTADIVAEIVIFAAIIAIGICGGYASTASLAGDAVVDASTAADAGADAADAGTDAADAGTDAADAAGGLNASLEACANYLSTIVGDVGADAADAADAAEEGAEEGAEIAETAEAESAETTSNFAKLKNLRNSLAIYASPANSLGTSVMLATSCVQLGTGIFEDVMNERAAGWIQKADNAEANYIEDEAVVNLMESFIQNTNSIINNILKQVTDSINAASGTLANDSPSNPLNDLYIDLNKSA
jgi:hypothetical protein